MSEQHWSGLVRFSTWVDDQGEKNKVLTTATFAFLLDTATTGALWSTGVDDTEVRDSIVITI
jgi:hypothetical protein